MRTLIAQTTAALLLTSSLSLSPLAHATAASAEPPAPNSVGLLAYAGDRFQWIRQRQTVGSHMGAYDRRSTPIKGADLNRLILTGLDKATETAFPEAQRVLLDWTPDATQVEAWSKESGGAREARIEAAVLAHLRALPQRQQWDQIIAVLPKYQFGEAKGMGSQLMGMGVYVQPLQAGPQLNTATGLASDNPIGQEGDESAINPSTGERVKASRYTAPYFYFQILTLDAKSLQVLKRHVRLDAIKYANPNDQAVGRMEDLNSDLMAQAMGKMVERSTLRAVAGSVFVGPQKVIKEEPKQP